MSTLCTWCGTEHGDGAGFCSEGCRQDFDTACRIWGAREYEAERVSIFDLRTLLGQHTRCVQRDSAPEGCQSTTEAPARSDAA